MGHPVLHCNIVQIVTCVKVTVGNCFARLGKYCPMPKVDGYNPQLKENNIILHVYLYVNVKY